MRVLLIEDDHATAQSIELMLKSEGFNVYTTDLGEEGIDLGKIYDYDMIMLDLNLPDMNGLEVLRQLRVGKINTPVMILSGSTEIETKAGSHCTSHRCRQASAHSLGKRPPVESPTRPSRRVACAGSPGRTAQPKRATSEPTPSHGEADQDSARSIPPPRRPLSGGRSDHSTPRGEACNRMRLRPRPEMAGSAGRPFAASFAG